MAFTGDYPQGRSQFLTFPRRELLQKAVLATLLCLVPPRQLAVPFRGRPLPEFKLGDLVAINWIDESEKTVVDVGEVLGMRYVLKPEPPSICPANTWLYYVYWTHSTWDSEVCYPCYDGEPTMASDLRLVSHG